MTKDEEAFMAYCQKHGIAWPGTESLLCKTFVIATKAERLACAKAAEAATVPSFYVDDAKCVGLTHRPTRAACVSAILARDEQ